MFEINGYIYIYLASGCPKASFHSCSSPDVDTGSSYRSFDSNIMSLFAVFFNLFIGMEPFGVFRLLAEPHAVTEGFVLFQMDRNVIFLYLVMHEKNTD